MRFGSVHDPSRHTQPFRYCLGDAFLGNQIGSIN